MDRTSARCCSLSDAVKAGAEHNEDVAALDQLLHVPKKNVSSSGADVRSITSASVMMITL